MDYALEFVNELGLYKRKDLDNWIMIENLDFGKLMNILAKIKHPACVESHICVDRGLLIKLLEEIINYRYTWSKKEMSWIENEEGGIDGNDKVARWTIDS